MKEVALATDYSGQHTTIAEMDACLKEISQAGFSHTHWCHDWDSSYIYAPSEIRQIAYLHKKYALKAKAIHGSCGGGWRRVHGVYRNRPFWDDRKDYTSENEYAREAGVELIRNRVDLAYALNAGEVVLHMQLPWESFSESNQFKNRYFNQVFKSFDELQPYCLERGIKLAIENLPGEPNNLSKERFDLLFERYSSEYLGFCFDSGHALIMSEGDPLELLELYSHRLVAIHLHDNKGATKEELLSDPMTSACDLHMTPLSGSLDWDRLAKFIAASTYSLPVCLESCFNEGSESRDLWLKRNLAVGIHLNNLILSHQNLL
ncbi:sugar phosphate isomerase/epimerase [Vibrio lamellibrachiae]|uniref:sugar phosphate isomerase/epimerase family protein n=1 Tax=Vibrio lamellibrachiae TaxID=2910253 RepID=UPI003D0FF1C3